MSAELLALGVSHKTAPVALRERLALPEGRASGFLNELVGHPEIREAVAISTCNRTEIYLVVGDPVEAESVALAALARQAEMRPTELLGRLYALRDVEAGRHLLGGGGGVLRGKPPLRPRDRTGAAVRGRRRSLRRPPGAARGSGHRGELHVLAAPDRRPG